MHCLPASRKSSCNERNTYRAPVEQRTTPPKRIHAERVCFACQACAARPLPSPAFAPDPSLNHSVVSVNQCLPCSIYNQTRCLAVVCRKERTGEKKRRHRRANPRKLRNLGPMAVTASAAVTAGVASAGALGVF